MNSTLGGRYADPGPTGYCDGREAATPRKISNRYGLSALVYRVGTHPEFKQSLLSGLNRVTGLHTRQDDDFSIALLDAWAMVADVLSFYQERIANEAYLGTATERRSLFELARLIGYRLRPGVAASVYLALILEDAPGAPEQAARPTTIDRGLKVQSTPGPGEQPQTFETVETIEARPEWNAMRPRLTQDQVLAPDMSVLVVRGTVTGLKPGDSLLIVTGTADQQREVKRVVTVTAAPDSATTRVELTADPPEPAPFVPPHRPPGLFLTTAFRLSDRVVASNILGYSWRQADLHALASVQNWPMPALVRNMTKLAAQRELPAEIGVFAFRQRAALFGHNAPKWDALPATQRFGERIKDKTGTERAVDPAYPTNWDTPARTLSQETRAARIDLDRTYPNIVAGSWLVLENAADRRIYRVADATETSRCDFTLSAKVTRLQLDRTDGFATFTLRDTAALAESERLELADLPIPDPVEGTRVTLNGIYPGLKVGQRVVLSGQRMDLTGVVESEVMVLADVTFSAGFTTLSFKQALAHRYVRSTVTLNANVALATHGETVRELLGSGQAALAHQSFALRQAPLTYVSSDAPSGADSTLEIRVNDLLWHEFPSFHGRDGRDRVFVTQTDETGRTTLQFGDGASGARVPSGVENVAATYRRGIGTAGNMEAGQLNQLLSRPLGVRSVSNPLPASGGADAETRDEIRRNAALAIMTLDRIVSLRDYENFARAFSGIGKALATWTWSGQRREVFVTVAGPAGADVTPDGRTCANLLAAMRKASDPAIPVRVQSYRKAYFRLAGAVTIAPDAVVGRVLAAVESALRAAFSFEARAFGQPVSLSEVMSVIQKVAGVTAVDLDVLVRTDGIGGSGLVRPLPAAYPQAQGETALSPAELLILDPRPVDLAGSLP